MPEERVLYVELPEKVGDEIRRLPFYLAMEEYLAREVVPKVGASLFFMWRVNPTVIIGRNQVAENEVNLEYCQREGIEVYRRKSGGGCVFADRRNIMMSYVTAPLGDVEQTFGQYTGAIADMLCELGLDATASSRNDILIGDCKVSGNAYYHLPHSSIVHGTMLFDADLERMSQAITPSALKLQSKGVESVRSRVTMLSKHLNVDLEDFMVFARTKLCNDTLILTAEDVASIEDIEAEYYGEEWIFKAKKPSKRARKQRIEGVGEVYVDVATDETGCIADVNLTGDFFSEESRDALLVERLRGVNYNPDAVVKAMEGFSAGNVISGMTNEQLIELLF